MKVGITGLLVRYFLVLLLAVCVTITADSAQQNGQDASASPVFHASSRLVVVDVVVTQHDRPVEDLKNSDFNLLEDGKIQKIMAFEPHLAKDRKPLQKLPELPPTHFTNFPLVEDSGPVNIVLFDLLNTFAIEQDDAKRQMIQFLKGLPPGHRLALFVLGNHLQIIQPFTGNTDALIAAAEAMGTHQSSLVTSEDERLTYEFLVTEQTGPRDDPGGNQARLIEAFNTQIKMQENQRAEKTLQAFTVLTEAVSGYPGRKNVIWLSTNFPFRFGPQDGFQKIQDQHYYLKPFQKVATLMAASQIAVYPIDIGGLKTGGPSGVSVPGGVSAKGELLKAARQASERWDSQEAMTDIAVETGGRAYYGTNDFKDMMQQSLQQGENYYTLAYVPENRNWNGNYRKIKVKVARDGAKLDYRHGYYAVDNTGASRSEALSLLAPAMRPTVPDSTMLLMRVQVLPPGQDHKTVTIDYAVAASEVAFSDGPDHLKHAELDFMAFVWDKEIKEVTHVVTPVDLNIRDEVYAQMRRTGVPAHQELDLKPGTYFLRVGVVDRQSQKIGTVSVPLTVTDPGK